MTSQPHEQNLSSRVNLSLTDDEYAALSEVAAERGMSKAAFMRALFHEFEEQRIAIAVARRRDANVRLDTARRIA